MPHAAMRDSTKRFGPGPRSRVTDEHRRNRLGNSRQADGSASWHSVDGWEEGAYSSLQGGTGRGRRLARRHRAGMLSAAPAARGKFRVRIRCENRRTDQRKAEQSHQQYCRHAAHGNYCTPLQTTFQQDVPCSNNSHERARNTGLKSVLPWSVTIMYFVARTGE